MKLKKIHYFLIIIFIAVWIWAAINPLDRSVWLVENTIVFVAVPALFVLGRYFKFSNLTAVLLTIFICLHLIGSHYGYGSVPIGFYLGEIFGSENNIYDRLVHFSFGLLMYYPIREVFLRVADTKGFWSYYLPLDVIISFSAVFEIYEWWGVRLLPEQVGFMFIGGKDVWDAQKDMLIALIGAVTALLVAVIINWANDKHFWDRIKRSFHSDNSPYPDEDKAIHEIKLSCDLR